VTGYFKIFGGIAPWGPPGYVCVSETQTTRGTMTRGEVAAQSERWCFVPHLSDDNNVCTAGEKRTLLVDQ